MRRIKYLFCIAFIMLSPLFSACGTEITQEEYENAIDESYSLVYNEGYDKGLIAGVKDGIKLSKLNGSYECIDVSAVPIKNLPVSEYNVFYTDNFLINISDGYFTCWDNSGDFGFGPAVPAPEGSTYDYIVYCPTIEEINGEILEGTEIIAYMDSINNSEIILYYTADYGNLYFTDVVARFKKTD